MPDKISNNDIKKALEDLKKCNNNEIDCGNCTLSEFYPRCPEEIGELALAYINRIEAQKVWLENEIINRNNAFLKVKTQLFSVEAENKRLKGIKTTDWLIKGIPTEQLEQEKIEAIRENAYKLGKAEAYKEFLEKLYEELRMYGIKDKFNKSVFLNIADKVKKEMVGEDNA